jgi:hypothetical protein
VLDGIGYQISFQTLSTSMRLHIQSPSGPSLVRLERALLSTAEQAQRLASSVVLAQALEAWRTHLRPGAA